MLRLWISVILASCSLLAAAQNFTEILGRPTANSVTMSILFDQKAEVYWEYGTSGGNYSMKTPTFTATIDAALEAVFTGLALDTRYYYRTRYRNAGSSGEFLNGAEHTFHTQRSAGKTFSFAVEADPHLDTNTIPASYALTLQNILNAGPDFLFDLGDTFMSEKLQAKTQENITSRHLLYRPYFGATCHSVPLFLVIGNHEGENGWIAGGSPATLPVMAANTRKLYYPNPVPDGFYSGDSIPEPYVGLRQNYYAWEWGDALFIVLDPYWYTKGKPDWGWTLGGDQYKWFSKVISGSKAKFKFVFCHQLVGGSGNDARGGAEFAGLFEMGGKNSDLTWGFDAYRPGWEKPIHQLMVDCHASIYFHGHDHFFGKQDLDGVVYQELPQPSSKNINNANQASQYGYVNGLFLPSRGYLLVTVGDSIATVEYIKTFLPDEETPSRKNGDVAYSYILHATPSAVEEKIKSDQVYRLGQNYPNPFSGTTAIPYEITQAGTVCIKVYDAPGREVSTLVDQYQQPGKYIVTFNPGTSPSAGHIYYYRIIASDQSKTMKMICIQ
ncbi:MAG: metallophosphoesterase [Bacteroidota bacterium]